MTYAALPRIRSSFAGMNPAEEVSLPHEQESTWLSPEADQDDFGRVRAAVARAESGSAGSSSATLPEDRMMPCGGYPPQSMERRQQPVPRISKLFPAVAPTVAPSSFHALQEWEGHVTEIDANDFHARLVDITAGASVEGEEARIPLAEVSEEDARRMKCGSVFRWVIGYERSPAGTKKRVSQIVFRDLPALTRRDLREGRAWAREVIASLNS